MNITDVGHLSSDADTGEDKMLKGAKRENKSVMDIAKFYTCAFFGDCAKLNIKTPDVVQPATGMIPEYIQVITKLLETGYAYLAGGNVYFDTSKLAKYYVFNDHDEETWSWASVTAWRRTPTSAIRRTSFCGSPNLSSRIRLSSGIPPGGWVTPAGILNAPAFP